MGAQVAVLAPWPLERRRRGAIPLRRPRPSPRAAPTRYGCEIGALVLFSVNVGRLAAFYQAVLGVTAEPDPWGGIQLRGQGVDLLAHPTPAGLAEAVEPSTPPDPRSGCAIKPVFDVDSLEGALAHVEAAGGVDTGRTFAVDGFTLHDVLDPDGNVVQLRERRS